MSLGLDVTLHQEEGKKKPKRVGSAFTESTDAPTETRPEFFITSDDDTE